MRAALYLRMSADKTGEELGVTRQREDCQKLADVRGWDVVTEYVENDTSAAGKVERPKFDAMLRAVKSGALDVVVAWNLDRLTRNRPDTLRLIELGQDARLVIALARGTDLDMSTPMGRMMADQLAGWARYEIEQKSERHRRANEQRAKSGLPHKGRRAYGYMADGLTICEDEALVLKDIAAKFLSGYTYTQLADYMNERGYRTVMGGKFYGVAIRQMFMRVRYAGVREHDGALYPAAWPAIWNDDTYTRIQHTIRQRSEAAGNRPAYRRHLLTGLLTCGSCGAPMNGTTTYDRRTGEPRKTYRCNRERTGRDGQPGCGKVSRSAFALEWWVRQLICYRLDSPEMSDLLNKSGGDGKSTGVLLNKKAALEARLEALVDDFTDGTLTKPEYKRAKERAQAALAAVRRELEALHHDRSLSGLVGAGEAVRRRWEVEGEGWRRGIVELLIEDITISASGKKPRIKIGGRTHYFDSSAVTIKWKC